MKHRQLQGGEEHLPDDLKKIVATDIDSEQGEDGGGKGDGKRYHRGAWKAKYLLSPP